jgi:hypothetical protein
MSITDNAKIIAIHNALDQLFYIFKNFLLTVILFVIYLIKFYVFVFLQENPIVNGFKIGRLIFLQNQFWSNPTINPKTAFRILKLII